LIGKNNNGTIGEAFVRVQHLHIVWRKETMLIKLGKYV